MTYVFLSNENFEKNRHKALVIDVRSPMEHKVLSHFDEDKNYYIYDLLQDPEKFLSDKNQMIITYCNGGNRSSEAALQLRSLGYHNAYVLKDGIYGYEKWKKQQEKK